MLLLSGNPAVVSVASMGLMAAANPLIDIFPADDKAPNPEAVVAGIQQHDLFTSLTEGTVYLWLQRVEGSRMPRVNSLAAIPSHYMVLYRRALDFNSWAEWMPRFIESKYGQEGGLTGPLIHEAKTDGGVRNFHYQNKVTHGEIPNADAAQIRWKIHRSDDFEADGTGLRQNDGIWTFLQFPDDRLWSLMLYQLHMVPDIKDFFIEALKLGIKSIVAAEFQGVAQSLANRASNPHWTLRLKNNNPSGIEYKSKVYEDKADKAEVNEDKTEKTED